MPPRKITQKNTKKNTKRKRKSVSVINVSVPDQKRKKAKQVKTEKEKLKALAELKKVRGQIDKMNAADRKRFESQDKLFNKSRTLREKLGID